MQHFFETLWKIICEVFGVGETLIPLAQYNGWHFVVLFFGGILIIAVFAGLVFLAGWLIWTILKMLYNIVSSIFSAKKKCSKIVCSSCGRTLDKCTCQKNKNKGYFARLALYSREKKASQRAKKLALKENKKKDR